MTELEREASVIAPPSTALAVKGPFFISEDKELLDVDVVHGFLSRCYWSPDIHRSRVELAIRHSRCFAVYDTRQARPGDGRAALVAFGRLITDYMSLGYLADVFVLEPYQGQGLGSWLIATIVSLPDVAELRKLALVTRDAQSLYARYGFTHLDPTRNMERADPTCAYRTPTERQQGASRSCDSALLPTH